MTTKLKNIALVILSDRSALSAAATGPPAVQAGQQFHGRSGHPRAHVRVLALHTTAAVAPLGGQRRRRLATVRQSVSRSVRRRGDVSAAATAQHAYAAAGHGRSPRVRVRLPLLRAARGGPPNRRAQVGGHVAHTGVPPPDTAATATATATDTATATAAVHRPARVVLAVGRNAPRVAEGPRPVPGSGRVAADAASAVAATVASCVASAPTATATANTVAATTAAAPVRQLRFRDGDHRHRRRLDDQREVPVAH